jgi:hypothetical protein
VDGRDFTDTDDSNGMPVLIVNQSFARRFFAGANPIGRRVRFWGRWATVIGLAQDSKYFDIAEAPRPHFYAPYRQRLATDSQLYVFIRTAGDPAAAMVGLRRQVAAGNRNSAAFDLMPLVEWTEVTLLPQKVAASLLAALGLTALVLAAVGLYSVLAYAVARRTQEIGVRMALGARPHQVLGSMLWRGLVLAIPGLLIGTVVAFAAARLVATMLINMRASDPATFGGAALFLATVALVASYVPARRATKVDPLVALRCE